MSEKKFFVKGKTEDDIVNEFYDILKKNKPNFLDKHSKIIHQASDFAQKAHKGQYRKHSGRSFIHHPLKVALMILQRFDDIDLFLAGILHDTVEDNENVSMSDIYQQFGHDTGFLVDSVTDNINFFYQDPKAKYKDKIEKLLYGGIKDIRCLILKLTDRKHNLISLEGLQPHKQIRMSFETQAIYEPLKKIFDCDQDPDIQICKTSLKNFLKQHNIQTAQKLQETLYKQSLYDIDRDTFDIVYKHTDTIVWKIEDKEMYLKLVNTKDFDEKVEVISIEQDLDGKFCSTFKYKKGKIFDNIKIKLEIENSEFSS